MKKGIVTLIAFATLFSNLDAAYIFKNGRLINLKEVATLPFEEHYKLGIDALKEKEYKEAARQFRIINASFSNIPASLEINYFLGVANAGLCDYDLANQHLTAYLQEGSNQRHFTKALEYKMFIANAYQKGAKKHLFGQEILPQWLSGKDDALKIYDEIINLMPASDMAAKALFAKATLFRDNKNFKGSRETFQILATKFPKSQYAINSYLKISDLLFEECQLELQNPDLIPLAKINLKKFENDFPRDDRVRKAQTNLLEMQEVLANGLYEIGQFFERKKSPKASVLYYEQAIEQYPQTKIAAQCQERIKSLANYVKELGLQ